MKLVKEGNWREVAYGLWEGRWGKIKVGKEIVFMIDYVGLMQVTDKFYITIHGKLYAEKNKEGVWELKVYWYPSKKKQVLHKTSNFCELIYVANRIVDYQMYKYYKKWDWKPIKLKKCWKGKWKKGFLTTDKLIRPKGV